MDPFYANVKKDGHVEEHMRHLSIFEIDKLWTYQIYSEVGVDINARSEFNVRVRIKVKVELVKWVSKLVFELRKYKLNYLFKYSKSVVESSSIIPT